MQTKRRKHRQQMRTEQDRKDTNKTDNSPRHSRCRKYESRKKKIKQTTNKGIADVDKVDEI